MTKKRAKAPKTKQPRDWSEAITGFLDALINEEKSEITLKNYREDLIRFTEWYQHTYEERPVLALIQPEELRAFKTQLRETEQLAPATCNRKLAAIRSFLRWAESAGLAPDIQTPKDVARVEPPPRWLEPRQQRALLRSIRRIGKIRDDAIITLLLHTGLRVDELADLQWRDLNVRERSGTLTVRQGKGRKQRTIPLNAEARAAVKQLEEIATARRWADKSPLPGQCGPLGIRGIQGLVQEAGKNAGIEGLSPHVLRHSFGKNMADSGARLEVIADLMGHESLETTRRYVQPGRADLAAAVERIAGGSEDEEQHRRHKGKDSERRRDYPGQKLIPGFHREE